MPTPEHELEHGSGCPGVQPDPKNPGRGPILDPIQQVRSTILTRSHRVRVAPEREGSGNCLIHKDPRWFETRDFHAPSLRDQSQDPDSHLQPGPDLESRWQDEPRDRCPAWRQKAQVRGIEMKLKNPARRGGQVDAPFVDEISHASPYTKTNN